MVWKTVLKRGSLPDVVREHETGVRAEGDALRLAMLHGSRTRHDPVARTFTVDASNFYSERPLGTRSVVGV